MFLFAGMIVAAVVPSRAAQSRPNVVLILADDLGCGDVGCYGATKIKTPNIDRLAREGRSFTNAYTPGSVCSPTRYGLMAGRYVWREPRHHPTGVHAPGGPLLDITPAAPFTGTSACGPYGDFVQELDAHVGQIRAALEKAGVTTVKSPGDLGKAIAARMAAL